MGFLLFFILIIAWGTNCCNSYLFPVSGWLRSVIVGSHNPIINSGVFKSIQAKDLSSFTGRRRIYRITVKVANDGNLNTAFAAEDSNGNNDDDDLTENEKGSVWKEWLDRMSSQSKILSATATTTDEQRSSDRLLLDNMINFIRVVCQSDRQIIRVDRTGDDINLYDTIGTLGTEMSDNRIAIIKFPVDLAEDAGLNLTSKTLLQAFALPSGISWPFFFAEKQTSAVLTNVLFQRVVLPQCLTHAYVDLCLDRKKNALIAGCPGIGKKAMNNLVLLQLLDKMRRNDTLIRTVYVRAPAFTFRLTCSDTPTKPSTSEWSPYVFLADCGFEIELITANHHIPLEKWEHYEPGGGSSVVIADIGGCCR